MVVSTVKFTTRGPLHNNPERHFKEAVTRALDVAVTRSVREVRGITPVDTGRLRDGWEPTQRVGWDVGGLDNAVPYYSFVDRRVDLTGRSQRILTRTLTRQLGTEIVRALS